MRKGSNLILMLSVLILCNCAKEDNDQRPQSPTPAKVEQPQPMNPFSNLISKAICRVQLSSEAIVPKVAMNIEGIKEVYKIHIELKEENNFRFNLETKTCFNHYFPVCRTSHSVSRAPYSLDIFGVTLVTTRKEIFGHLSLANAGKAMDGNKAQVKLLIVNDDIAKILGSEVVLTKSGCLPSPSNE